MNNPDVLYCVWLPTDLRDAISQRLESLNKRAAKRYVRYKIGERVKHKKFGEAVVTDYLPQLIGDTIEVKFKNGAVGQYDADPKFFVTLLKQLDSNLV